MIAPLNFQKATHVIERPYVTSHMYFIVLLEKDKY
jgi:hypothetical protein